MVVEEKIANLVFEHAFEDAFPSLEKVYRDSLKEDISGAFMEPSLRMLRSLDEEDKVAAFKLCRQMFIDGISSVLAVFDENCDNPDLSKRITLKIGNDAAAAEGDLLTAFHELICD